MISRAAFRERSPPPASASSRARKSPRETPAAVRDGGRSLRIPNPRTADAAADRARARWSSRRAARPAEFSRGLVRSYESAPLRAHDISILSQAILHRASVLDGSSGATWRLISAVAHSPLGRGVILTIAFFDHPAGWPEPRNYECLNRRRAAGSLL